MICRVALRQRFRGTLSQEALHREPLGADLGQRQLVGAGAGDHHEVDATGKEVGPGSEAFAAKAFDAIPPDCAADLSSDDQSQPREGAARSLRSDEQREVRGSDASS